MLEASSEPTCPTCGQPLSAEHRHNVIGDLQTAIDSRRELYRDNQARLKALNAESRVARPGAASP